MEHVFGLVLVTSFYASIVGLAILLIKGLFKSKLSARWHYIVWFVLLVKLLIPFGPESALSLFNTIPPELTQTKISHLAVQMEQEYNAAMKSGDTVTKVSSETMVQIVRTGATVESTLPYVWFFGAVFMLGWLIYTNYSLHAKLQNNGRAVDERIYGIFGDCKRKMGVKNHVEIVVQDFIATPALFGLMKPKVLISPTISTLSDKELKYILLHELAHFKRKDVLVNYLLLALQTLHWFNPIMWYCFKRIRQDMELATDERVLSLLEETQHKEYGKALLAVLESCIPIKLAPKLIGMVDDGKDIENRIRMIKMAEFFKGKRRLVIAMGVLCVVMLSGLLLTNAKGNDTDPHQKDNISGIDMAVNFDAEKLLKYKTPYIGNASNVSNLLNTLPLGQYKTKLSLETKEKPYGLKVDYDLTGGEQADINFKEQIFWINSAILFSLVENLDNINYNIQVEGNSYNQQYTRAAMQAYFEKDLKDYSTDVEEFRVFLSLAEDFGSEMFPSHTTNGAETLEQAVVTAILSRGPIYSAGEVVTEGHIILDKEEKGGEIKVYTLASFGSFGFENGIFTKVSGSGAIPTVMTFAQNEKGGYTLLKYQEPQDGKEYANSLKKMFPPFLLEKVQGGREYYSDLAKQQEVQAKAYLNSIGRDAEVTINHVEKKLASINVEASNKLFSEMTKHNIILAKCPYWLGTREQVENGVRYIYETSQSKTPDGYDLITFKRTKEDGSIVEEYRYKIVGSEPVLQRE